MFHGCSTNHLPSWRQTCLDSKEHPVGQACSPKPWAERDSKELFSDPGLTNVGKSWLPNAAQLGFSRWITNFSGDGFAFNVESPGINPWDLEVRTPTFFPGRRPTLPHPGCSPRAQLVHMEPFILEPGWEYQFKVVAKGGLRRPRLGTHHRDEHPRTHITRMRSSRHARDSGHEARADSPLPELAYPSRGPKLMSSPVFAPAPEFLV